MYILGVILYDHVRGAEVEEAADEIFGLEEGSQHIDQLFFSFLGVDQILVDGYQLETLRK